MGGIRPFLCRLSAPVDNASLVFFRLAFGAMMLWEVIRYFSKGWIHRYWIEPRLNFPYNGFEWLHPLPGIGMYVLFAALGLLSLCILLGIFYRICAALFFLGFTYQFLLEQALHLNHFYLILLVGFLIIFLPLHHSFSLDVRCRPELAAGFAPVWTLWLLRFQLGVVYFYAGIAKLNTDWLQGQPMTMWLAERPDFPVIGSFFREAWAGPVFSYGGLLFDLLIVPALLCRRTRVAAFLAATLFHLTNAALFHIGIFPWFMIAATTLFFAPDWPRRLLWRFRSETRNPVPPNPPSSFDPPSRLVVTLLCLYALYQCLMPLRHFLREGDPAWTEEGHRYSWRMKLRSKAGTGHFLVRDTRTGTIRGVAPAEFLSEWQISDMLTTPHMIWQFSRFLEREYQKSGHDEVEIYGWISVSLNGRPFQAFIDPSVDLTKVKFSPGANPWVLPLTTPLHR